MQRERETERALIRDVAHPIESDRDYDPLFRMIGDAAVVMIGATTHGTHEFQLERARITKRLIDELGFDAIAIEADWPDAAKIDRYVRGRYTGSAEDALRAFDHFPQWLWHNSDMLDFVGWLRGYNDSLGKARAKIPIFGLDLYALYSTMARFVTKLERDHPQAAEQARLHCSFFDHFGENPAGANLNRLEVESAIEEQVVRHLIEERRRASISAPEEPVFTPEQSAHLMRDLEKFYRAMFLGRSAAWNLRERHMASTLKAITRHLSRRHHEPKIVVWAHSSHVGDARATEMLHSGDLSLGQIVREHYGTRSVLIGLTTYDGTVTASSGWGSPAERKPLRPAVPGSWEDLLYKADIPQFLMTLRDKSAIEELSEPRLQRAVGVVYTPEHERESHFFYSRLSSQYDAIVHIDHTRAIEAMEHAAFAGGAALV